MHLIGLDIGTTGCKAIVFDLDGRAVGRAFREYGVECAAPGMAEQDAERVWMLAKEVLREAVAAGGVTQARALSVSVQGDAIIAVDRGFRPLHRAILGMDCRSAAHARRCGEVLGETWLFERTGMRPHAMNSLCKILLLRELAPAVMASAWKLVTYADYIMGRLGAGAKIDHTMASRTMAFDLATRRWAPEILGPLGLEAGMLSEPVASGTVVGVLDAELADELGLPRGLVLVAGGHDQTCAALGAGVVRSGLGVISTGTAEVLSTAMTEPALSQRMFESFYPCYLDVRPGMYFTFGLNHVGGMLLRWWRDQFAAADVADAAAVGVDAYRLIDERMPAGLSPVMVVPHLNGTGTPWCDLEARGAIVGLSLATTRHDVAKALLEGLTFELRINLDTMEECGIEVTELAAVGGGAKSGRWVQLKADILGRPIRTLRCGEAACLGAALLAGVGVGAYGNLEEAVGRAVVVDRVYLPEPGAVRSYGERFEVYRRLYPALKGVRLSG